MAGYIFNLNNIKSLRLYTNSGVYATVLKRQPQNRWMPYHEATFSDYTTMKVGDNIFFFIKRKIYGIGELVKIFDDCKFANFPEACQPKRFDYLKIRNLLLWDEGDFSVKQRWLCVFKPSPFFFVNGLDMDDVLSSNPSAFRMLRAFWKVSFIKFDDEENQALKDVILKFNQEALCDPKPNINIFQCNYSEIHKTIESKINPYYKLDIAPILDGCASSDYLAHEMALEAGILYQLSYCDSNTIEIFGHWDYLSHQVVASPFKPIDYMDKMDIFGYSFITGFAPTKSRYLVAEIKKDSACTGDIDQLMKYIDWIKEEYCLGEYSMINAFLVAYNFPNEVIQYKKEAAKRHYTIGRRPARSLKWENLKLVKYSYNQTLKKIKFTVIS